MVWVEIMRLIQTIEGAVGAINEFGIDVIITGDKSILEENFNKYSFDKSKLEIIHTSEVILNEDKPVKAIRRQEGFFNGSCP